jgi:hypothetical protein
VPALAGPRGRIPGTTGVRRHRRGVHAVPWVYYWIKPEALRRLSALLDIAVPAGA